MVKLRLSSLKGGFASQTGFLVVATVTGYTFSYLYLVFMSRALGPEVFGILGSLVAIFYIACLVGQALREAIARNVAEIKARDEEAGCRRHLCEAGVGWDLPGAVGALLASTAIAIVAGLALIWLSATWV